MYMTANNLHLRCLIITARLVGKDNGRLRIHFCKAGMEKRYLKRHFRWSLFQVLESFELPTRVRRKLGLTQGWIEPGIYTVWEMEDFLIVDF